MPETAKIDLGTISGLGGRSRSDIDELLSRGARFVFFEYCISFVLFSLRRPSSIQLVRPEEWGWVRGLPYTLLTLFCGWWGVPWGFIYTPIVLVNNMAGGCDVTAQVCALLDEDKTLTD